METKDMNGPLCRTAAASCLVWLALTTGAARAESIPVTEPDPAYPELTDKPIVYDVEQEVVSDTDVTILPWPDDTGAAESSTGDTPIMPVKTEDGWMWTYNGVEYRCDCVCPPVDPPGGPGGPTIPAEQAPEPSTLVLLGIGAAGLALARRRRG
jgi:hypothetical protein